MLHTGLAFQYIQCPENYEVLRAKDFDEENSQERM